MHAQMSRALLRCLSDNEDLFSCCSGLTESIANYLTRFPEDRIQMRLSFETFSIDLINILSAGWPGCEPAGFRNHLEAADGSIIAGGPRQFGKDDVAREL